MKLQNNLEISPCTRDTLLSEMLMKLALEKQTGFLLPLLLGTSTSGPSTEPSVMNLTPHGPSGFADRPPHRANPLTNALLSSWREGLRTTILNTRKTSRHIPCRQQFKYPSVSGGAACLRNSQEQPVWSSQGQFLYLPTLC